MIKIALATANAGKIREITEILYAAEIEWVIDKNISELLHDAETSDTFFENARSKAFAVVDKFNTFALADDSGLVVDALNGRPGVYSARFAGENATDMQNIEKLLNELDNVPSEQRTARFVCVAVLVLKDKVLAVGEGYCSGKITDAPIGENGFGYDPVFVPDGYELTMAQLSPEEKNKISHRRKALEKIKPKITKLLSLAD